MALLDPHGSEALPDEQPVARQSDDVTLAHLGHQQGADPVDQRDAGLDQDQGPQVRVPAADRRRGVDDRRDPGVDQTLGRHAIEVLVVDHGDVSRLGPGHQVLRPPVDASDARVTPASARPAA